MMPGSLRAFTALLLLVAAMIAWPAAGGARAGFEEGLQAYQKGDFRAAFTSWIDLARDGDPAAMRNVGHLYRWGQGVPQDLTAAADWYRRAAEMGLDRAQANLAMMYLQGQGVEADPAQAAYWFSQAAIQGHTVAQYNLAQLYQQGRGVQRNEALALGWLQRAAKAGHPQALAQLGALVAEAPPPDPALQKRQAAAGDGAVAPATGRAPSEAQPATGSGLPESRPRQPKAAAPEAPKSAGAVPAAVAAPAVPPVDTDGEESLETPTSGEAPALVDRLAGVFAGEAEEASPPLPSPRPDAESGTISPRSARAPAPVLPADPSAPAPPAAAEERSDAENWVLALITDAVSDEEAPSASPSPTSAAAAGSARPPAPASASGTGSQAGAAAPAPAAPNEPGDLSPLETVAGAALRAYRAGDYATARTELRPLADAGLGRAQYMLGWLDEAGLGGPADPAMAYYWYMRASTGGDFEGRRALEDLQRRIDPAARARARDLLLRDR